MSYYAENIKRLKPLKEAIDKLDEGRKRWGYVCKVFRVSWQEWKSIKSILGSEKRKREDVINMEYAKKNYTTYDNYLKTDWWQTLRRRALKNQEYHCQLCNDYNTELHVHHRSYKRKCTPNERKDLVVLCAGCHKMFHDRIGIKQL